MSVLDPLGLGVQFDLIAYIIAIGQLCNFSTPVAHGCMLHECLSTTMCIILFPHNNQHCKVLNYQRISFQAYLIIRTEAICSCIT